MRHPLRALSALLIAASLVGGPAAAKSRIKDIVEFEGVRENMLVGYGLVVGLNGTGDALRNALGDLENCHTGATCWAAAHLGPPAAKPLLGNGFLRN